MLQPPPSSTLFPYTTLFRSVLERDFPDIVAVEPAVLAQHFARAGVPEQAVGYYIKAARLAITRSAMSEAITILDRAMELLDRKSTRLNSSHLGISYAVFCLT